MFLGTSNLTVICKVETEIPSRRLISNKGAKKPEAIPPGSQIYEELQAITFFHLPNLSIHPDPKVSDDEGYTIPRQLIRFHSSLLQGFSFASDTTNEVPPIASSLTHQQKDETTTPSLQGLLTLMKIYISFQSYHLD